MRNVELIRKVYRDHAAGGVDAALEHCADDVRFIWMATPIDTPHAGRFSGKAEFGQQLRSLHAAFEYRKFDPIDFVDAGDRVAVRTEVHLTRRTTGQEFSVPVADFWTIRDGKVVELIEYYDTALVARML
jgi:ketosteroid isomerase-like protein